MVREPTLRREQPVRSEVPVENFKVNRVRASTNRIGRWRWSPCRLVVDPGWLHLSSSQWTSSSFPIQQINWCDKFYSDWSGRFASETCRWQLGISIQTEACQIRGKVAQSFFCWQNIFPTGYMWSEARLTNIRTTTRTRPCMTKSIQNGEEQAKLYNARRLTGKYFIDLDDQDCKNKQHFWKEKTGKTYFPKWFILAPRRWLRSRKLHPKRFPKRFVVEQWNLMNPQGHEWNLLHSQYMRIALQAKVSPRWPLAIWFTNSFQCLKRWKFRMQKLHAVDKEWKKLETTPAWQLESQE